VFDPLLTLGVEKFFRSWKNSEGTRGISVKGRYHYKARLPVILNVDFPS